jgi:hypothetical protein
MRIPGCKDALRAKGRLFPRSARAAKAPPGSIPSDVCVPPGGVAFASKVPAFRSRQSPRVVLAPVLASLSKAAAESKCRRLLLRRPGDKRKASVRIASPVASVELPGVCERPSAARNRLAIARAMPSRHLQ